MLLWNFLKKLWRAFLGFFTLNVRDHKGFTLVELIIVIAILAILSSVAVAGYSAYIEKANKQADMTLVNEIIHAANLYHYTEPLTGGASIKLTTNGAYFAGNEAWLNAALAASYGTNPSLKLKYNGWNSGLVYEKMMQYLDDNGLSDVYGNADNLSFTEEIPVLMDEIKDVAYEVLGDNALDEDVIALMNTAAGVTTKYGPDTFIGLWEKAVPLVNGEYDYTGFFAADDQTEAYEKQLTVAGVLRAKNTCLALYAAENGYPELYAALSGFSAEGSIVPWDLTHAANDATGEGQKRIAEVTGLSLNELAPLATLLNKYYNGNKDENGDDVWKNDARAYLTMMNVVNDIEGDFSGATVDEYFDALKEPVSAFQQLMNGSLNGSTLNFPAGSEGNGIVLTFWVENGELKWSTAAA